MNCLNSLSLTKSILFLYLNYLFFYPNFLQSSFSFIPNKIAYLQYPITLQMKRQQNSSSVIFSEGIKKTLRQIFQDFSKSEGIIDLEQAKKIIQQSNLKECELFKNKIDQATKVRMTQEQFISYFGQQCDNSSHFNAVFDLIDADGSGQINKKQLRDLNQKYNIGLSQTEITAMIEEISSDGQKVSKSQLSNFFAMKIQ